MPSTMERIVDVLKQFANGPDGSGIVPNEITERTTSDDFGMDSLSAIQVIVDIEEEFKIRITENDVDGDWTIKHLVEVVDRLTTKVPS